MANIDYKQRLDDAILQSDVVKIFDNLLTIAVEKGASDIHIEPLENYCRIRIRIDGILEELVQYPKTLHESIVSKFKIESGQMRPDEKRLPQDARVSAITQTDKEVDLRANTFPTVRGEKLEMRIVDKSLKIPPLEELGLEGSNLNIIYKNLSFPNGIILATGPTGSGKTTTLYACLDYVNTSEVNIITYEDPVENKMRGLNQAQIRADIGFTFASGLRGGLRQDPDIIMVGEVRDKETLDMAMESAMTGHLVFSTIHTNSAAETITRVYNLGAKPYMLAGTFNLVLAERLARRVCEHCKTTKSVLDDPKFAYAKDSFKNFNADLLKKEILARNISQEQRDTFIQKGIITVGTGKDPKTGETCPICGGLGYKGRIGLFELMDYTEELKNMLLNGKSVFEIENLTLQNGMINLERDGVFKVIKGITTLDEVYRYVKTKFQDSYTTMKQ
ncbi:MAG: type II secretion system protein GspE [candidate division SR1 bacterium CG_4_9_14_3_um_filter_40_9]|nr:MAG: type II secretion system protein GspE [candidate division SR1 bacterium CG_4_9_14_3_um_filter_40_9]